jgi:hypothetical protein
VRSWGASLGFFAVFGPIACFRSATTFECQVSDPCGASSANTTTTDTSTTDASTGAAASTTRPDLDDTSAGSSAADTSETGDSSGEDPGPAAFCGDGVVQPGAPNREECDFADPVWLGRCNALCKRDRYIFVASGPSWKAGDLLGIQGADNYCRSRAGVAGIDPALALRFRAFLSDSKSDAVDRLFHARGRYVLFDGTVVADDWDALLTEPLQHPIDLTETGEVLHNGVWTGMGHGTGRVVPGADNCADWTSSNPFEGEAYWGWSDEVDANWVFAEDLNPADCAGDFSIYCIEQE